MVDQVRRLWVPVKVIASVISNGMFVLTVLFFGWFWAAFTPLTVHDSAFATSRTNQFTFIQWSSKTPAGNLLCGRPDEAYVIFKDVNGTTFKVDDTLDRAGTGTTSTSRFEMAGTLPEGMATGPVWVQKAVNYPCILGMHKIVYSPHHRFDNPPINEPKQ